MKPEQGVRFELRLKSSADGSARYELSLELAASAFEGVADILGSGEVRFDWADGAAPPDWCVAAARAQLRMLFRDHGRDGDFPRRLTRWRPEPAPAPVPGRTE